MCGETLHRCQALKVQRQPTYGLRGSSTSSFLSVPTSIFLLFSGLSTIKLTFIWGGGIAEPSHHMITNGVCSSGCPTSWDEIRCWFRAEVGQVTRVSCVNASQLFADTDGR